MRLRDGLHRFGIAVLAFVSFAAPFAVSLAANITAGLHSGSSVLLVAGIAIPVLLMLAIEMWRRLPLAFGWALVGRSLAMSPPVLVAAGWSWADTTGLLLAQFPDPSGLQRTLCFAAPLAVDGLAILSVLSLRSERPESAMNQPSTSVPAQLTPAVTATESAEDEPAVTWGGPEAVTERRDRPVRAAAPTPIRKPVTAKPKTKTGDRSSRQKLCDRARVVGVRVNGKSNPELRADVERAERARSDRARDADDERERVPA